MLQQLCSKINPWCRPCSRPTPGSLWCLDLTQMVLDVRKMLKSTHLIIPNSFCFNNFAQKSIPGDVRAQVLQEPVGASHAYQGRKSGMPHPFSDPGGQAGSNGTPHLPLASRGAIPQGGRCCIIYNTNDPPLGKSYLSGWGPVWGTRGFLLTPRVQKWVGHPGSPDLISVGGSDR